MAIATYSSALNDRALCTSIALTMVRRAYVQALSQVTGRAGQARRDGGTSVSARALLRYVVRVQDAAFGGGSEDISFLLRPCLLDLHTHPGDGAGTTALSERAYKFCRTRIARGKWA